ncbi:hypothetical protein F4861DRAFT_90625 [Xylaria intraflava]|nr:hypothetical protein F4861DRAFT_90625 [Xylaria intraflava]
MLHRFRRYDDRAMLLSGVSAKNLCLWATLSSRLLFGSLCEDVLSGQTESELLLLGRPTALSSMTMSTITVTTSIEYKPSLIPGNSQYTLVGCYSQPPGDGEPIFGAGEHNACSEHAHPNNLTIGDCLGACGSATSPGNGTELYTYAGLRNGSECICGLQLSANAHKLVDGDCKIPCPGDPKLSCGGQDRVAIYSLIAGNARDNHNPQLESDHISASAPNDKDEPAITAAKPSTVNARSQDAISKAANSGLTHSASPGPGAQKTSVSTPTIAAITGSLGGAFIISAALILCYRARKRKRLRRRVNTKIVLEERSSPSLIVSGPSVHDNITNIPLPRSKFEHGPNGGNRGNGTDRGDLRAQNEIPTTPVVDSNQRRLGDLHARAAAAGTASRTGKAGDRDNLYSTLMEEVRSPTDTHPQAGASSAVLWRPGNTHSNVSATPHTAHNRATSSSGVPRPPPSANVDPLGERAWHRRKLSTPFQPAKGAKAGNTATVALEASSGTRGRNLASRGPPSGPPNAPLPPTPPVKRTGANRPPMRPRRSFDTVVFETEPVHYAAPDVTSASETDHGASKGAALGMSHSNVSTPTLGRFGSISRRRVEASMESPILGRHLSTGRRQRGVETSMESPILGRHISNGRRQRGLEASMESPILGRHISNGRRQRGLEASMESPILGRHLSIGRRQRGAPEYLADRQPTIPVLPPVAPGERFDHRRWQGTIYAELSRDDEGKGKERERQRNRGDPPSPASVSSVGTSILFTPQEFDRRL